MKPSIHSLDDVRRAHEAHRAVRMIELSCDWLNGVVGLANIVPEDDEGSAGYMASLVVHMATVYQVWLSMCMKVIASDMPHDCDADPVYGCTLNE